MINSSTAQMTVLSLMQTNAIVTDQNKKRSWIFVVSPELCKPMCLFVQWKSIRINHMMQTDT